MSTVPATLNNIPVLVLGLGESGLAIARWCARQGAVLRVWDSRSAPPQAAALAEELPSVVFLCGALGADTLQDAQFVFKSPGLTPHDPRMAPLLAAARAAGVPLVGDSQGGMFGFFFADSLPQNYGVVMATDKERFNRFFHAMLDRGVYLAPALYEAGFVSAAHSAEDIAHTVQAAAQALRA